MKNQLEETEHWAKKIDSEKWLESGRANDQRQRADTLETDYHRYYDENKLLKEHLSQVWEEKDHAFSEMNQMRATNQERYDELLESSNKKVAALTTKLQQALEQQWEKENESYDVIWRQEGLINKWKHQHLMSVEHF